MRTSLLPAIALCITAWTSFIHATQGPASSCCHRWSTTRVPVTQILNYTIQSEGICFINAVKFDTKSGKRICSDPNSKWAKRAIEKVDQETRGLEGSTTDVPPSVSPTSREAVVKKRSLRQGKKKSRRGRKGQRKCT